MYNSVPCTAFLHVTRDGVIANVNRTLGHSVRVILEYALSRLVAFAPPPCTTSTRLRHHPLQWLYYMNVRNLSQQHHNLSSSKRVMEVPQFANGCLGDYLLYRPLNVIRISGVRSFEKAGSFPRAPRRLGAPPSLQKYFFV